MAEINDHRKHPDRKPLAWIIATDRFMSGWGKAPGRSLFAIAVYDHETTSDCGSDDTTGFYSPGWFAAQKARRRAEGR